MTRPKYDWQRARELYDAGCNDREIARQIGAKYSESVRHWRAKNGLPSHVERRIGENLAAQIRNLLSAGKKTHQIAKQIKCSKAYVRAVKRRTPEVGRAENVRYREQHFTLIGLI